MNKGFSWQRVTSILWMFGAFLLPLRANTKNSFQYDGTAQVFSSLYFREKGARDIQFETYYSASFDCPLIPWSKNNRIFVADPTCQIPLQSFVEGKDAENFYMQNRLKSGDEVSITIERVERATQSISRCLHESHHNSSLKHHLNLGGIKEEPPVFQLTNFTLVRPSSQREIYIGQQIRIRTMIYLLDICNWTNPYRSATEYAQMIFESEDNPNKAPLNKTYNVCSYNKVVILPENTVILGPIKLGCSGFVQRGYLAYNWTASECGSAELFSWPELAEEVARNMSLTDPRIRSVLEWSSGRRIVTVLPPEVACSWAGLASVGCGGKKCNAYLKGFSSGDMGTVFHELQHNMGLSHSGFEVNEYGDKSCPMGSPETMGAQKMLCHNAPNMFRIGWSNVLPKGNLTMSNLTKTVVRFALPATSMSDTNMVRVQLPNHPTYFFSYRLINNETGYDSALPIEMNQNVFIHIFNGSMSMRDFNRTWLIARTLLPKPNTWISPSGLLKLKYMSTNYTHANITICLTNVTACQKL